MTDAPLVSDPLYQPPPPKFTLKTDAPLVSDPLYQPPPPKFALKTDAPLVSDPLYQPPPPNYASPSSSPPTDIPSLEGASNPLAQLVSPPTPLPILPTPSAPPALDRTPPAHKDPVGPKTSNYVRISRKSIGGAATSYKGAVSIDTNIRIPGASADFYNNRKNLEIEVEEGSIDVDIFLAGDNARVPPVMTLELLTDVVGIKKDSKHLTLNKYPIKARIYDPMTNEFNRSPFELKIFAVHRKPNWDQNTMKRGRWNASPIFLHLPRTFCGLISFSMNHEDNPISDSIWLSRGMKQAVVVQSEDTYSGSYFIGAPGTSSDNVTIKYSYGKLHLLYSDEAAPVSPPSIQEEECCCCTVQ